MTNWPKEIFKILCRSKDKEIQEGINALKSELQREMDEIVKEVQIINKHFTNYISAYDTARLSNEDLSLRIIYPYGFCYDGSAYYVILAKTPEIKALVEKLFRDWHEKNSKLGEMS